MTTTVRIAERLNGPDQPVFVIAELSANHNGDLQTAKRLLRLAAEAGADAVKLQTYTADSMTIDSDLPPFIVGEGTLWAGEKLYDLYTRAATPYDWYGELLDDARALGVHLFSTPFDPAAVDFLERFDPPAYKIASFELLDLRLIRAAADTGKPIIMSTGMASAAEIDEAVDAAAQAGDGGVVLLRCNSAYPAPLDQMDLRTIPEMRVRWNIPVGLSDHTLTNTAAVAAVALGACVVEKHVIERRESGGPDSEFSLEPAELADLVVEVRAAESALGRVRYGPSDRETASLAFRRSLWFVVDVAAGEEITSENVRSIRPAGGLTPAHLDEVLGMRTSRSVTAGTPVTRDLLEG